MQRNLTNSKTAAVQFLSLFNCPDELGCSRISVSSLVWENQNTWIVKRRKSHDFTPHCFNQRLWRSANNSVALGIAVPRWGAIKTKLTYDCAADEYLLLLSSYMLLSRWTENSRRHIVWISYHSLSNDVNFDRELVNSNVWTTAQRCDFCHQQLACVL